MKLITMTAGKETIFKIYGMKNIQDNLVTLDIDIDGLRKLGWSDRSVMSFNDMVEFTSDDIVNNRHIVSEANILAVSELARIVSEFSYNTPIEELYEELKHLLPDLVYFPDMSSFPYWCRPAILKNNPYVFAIPYVSSSFAYAEGRVTELENLQNLKYIAQLEIPVISGDLSGTEPDNPIIVNCPNLEGLDMKFSVIEYFNHNFFQGTFDKVRWLRTPRVICTNIDNAPYNFPFVNLVDTNNSRLLLNGELTTIHADKIFKK